MKGDNMTKKCKSNCDCGCDKKKKCDLMIIAIVVQRIIKSVLVNSKEICYFYM